MRSARELRLARTFRYYDLWLDAGVRSAELLRLLLRPYPHEETVFISSGGDSGRAAVTAGCVPLGRLVKGQ